MGPHKQQQSRREERRGDDRSQVAAAADDQVCPQVGMRRETFFPDREMTPRVSMLPGKPGISANTALWRLSWSPPSSSSCSSPYLNTHSATAQRRQTMAGWLLTFIFLYYTCVSKLPAAAALLLFILGFCSSRGIRGQSRFAPLHQPSLFLPDFTCVAAEAAGIVLFLNQQAVGNDTERESH